MMKEEQLKQQIDNKIIDNLLFTPEEIDYLFDGKAILSQYKHNGQLYNNVIKKYNTIKISPDEYELLKKGKYLIVQQFKWNNGVSDKLDCMYAISPNVLKTPHAIKSYNLDIKYTKRIKIVNSDKKNIEDIDKKTNTITNNTTITLPKDSFYIEHQINRTKRFDLNEEYLKYDKIWGYDNKGVLWTINKDYVKKKNRLSRGYSHYINIEYCTPNIKNLDSKLSKEMKDNLNNSIELLEYKITGLQELITIKKTQINILSEEERATKEVADFVKKIHINKLDIREVSLQQELEELANKYGDILAKKHLLNIK